MPAITSALIDKDAVEPGRICEGVRHRTIRFKVRCAIDHEEVPVAIDAGVTSRTTAEQPDLQWAPSLDHASEDRRDRPRSIVRPARSCAADTDAGEALTTDMIYRSISRSTVGTGCYRAAA
jgi:hypothetical protein